ncbi:MAG: LuxR C-terminal-related transcriptional regulator [Treponema sp.]|jgi:DNA-binding CsgD family transcriptional regulator|nr:LuxR C-terminal-related transcriptional regulator [Treponema sp.]
MLFASKKKIEMWVECGDDYFYGLDGEKKDYELAAGFYEKAAKKKRPYAAYMLGLCYELGDKDLRKNNEKAVEWYHKAAQLGNEDAQKRLASGKIFVPPPPLGDNQETSITNIDSANSDDFDHLNLTERELEIFNLLLTDAPPKEIAYNLEISYPTVNFHTNNLYRKLGIQSRAELFAKYGRQ